MNKIKILWLFLFISGFHLNAEDNTKSEIIFEDFEGNNYGQWKATGNAFNHGPYSTGTDKFYVGANPRWNVKNKGKQFLTSYVNIKKEGNNENNLSDGNDGTGTLTSPSFKISKKYISFQVSGGNHPGRTYINLIVDNKIFKSATGRSNRMMTWRTWDVSNLINREAHIEIGDQMIDDDEFILGHINIDHIVFSDEPVMKNVDKWFIINKKYLIWPIKRQSMRMSPESRVYLNVEDGLETFMDVELSQKPDFWVFTDLSNHQGKELHLKGVLYKDQAKAFDDIILSDEYPGMENLYKEELRPQFHFTSKRGWLNDANGMQYYDGEWHMFYQHNPYNWFWWNVSWGHAVSKDLIHWEELPTAIPPGPEGVIYSGSGAVDIGNTAGFQNGNEETMVLVYTAVKSHSTSISKGPTQALSYSTDRGRNWTKYSNNPVLPYQYPHNRDPKVFWYEPTKKWVMSLYNGRDDNYILYNSSNLKDWNETGSYSAAGSECPDMFQLPVNGDKSNKKWIIWTGNGNYRVGEFDGENFTPETESMYSYYGDSYAGQSFSNAPDGRRVNIGWIMDHRPGFEAGHKNMPFNQQMSLPLEMTLRESEAGYRMYINPIEELKALRGKKKSWENLSLGAGDNPLKHMKGDYFELVGDFDVSKAEEFGFNLRGKKVLYKVSSNTLICNDEKVNVYPEKGRLKLHIFLDQTSIETIVNDGWMYVSSSQIFEKNNHNIEFFVEKGTVKINSLDIYKMNSIWD